MRNKDPPRTISTTLWRRALTVLLTGNMGQSVTGLGDQGEVRFSNDECALMRDLISLEVDEADALYSLVDQVRHIEELFPSLRMHGIRPNFHLQPILDNLDVLEGKVYRMNLVREYLHRVA